MDKSFKSSIYIVGLIFLLSYLLAIFSIFLSGVLTLKSALFLFIATLISSLATVTILGGLFTSLGSHLIQLRRLFRLNNLTHPLLLKLQTEAPGTYHHSVLVANLAAAAAKEIGADGLLCRVAAYFHDVGKIKNPGYFIENQSVQKYAEENSENNVPESPLKKAKNIIDHVKDGVEIAKEYHLPKEVISLIAQHHGTSLCGFFYDIAKENNPSRTKRPSFRYDGPKPQTKEAAILMLADALEARVRAKNGSANNHDLVKETLDEKINDRQLDDANLSQKEISKLKDVFADVLEGVFHPRIEYR